jgi:hypothetical protein
MSGISTRPPDIQPDGHPICPACPAAVADILSFCGLNPAAVGGDWADVLAMAAMLLPSDPDKPPVRINADPI